MRIRTRTFAACAAVLTLSLFGAACSSNGSEGDASAPTTTAAAEETTTTEAPQTLTILVSNDDGVGAPGIDALVNALSELPDTEVIVSAPAENQSGSGSKFTPGELTTAEATTASGYPATAVTGFPADSVNWALDGGVSETPQLVVTGVNSGQNLGAIGDQFSGTVGAARAAAARGIPALATSMGLSDDADYDLAATYVVAWVEANRAALLDGSMAGDVVVIRSMNIPHCVTGEIRGEVEVTMSTASDGALTDQNCESTIEAPADDITAFNNGFVTLSDLTLTAAPAA